MYGGVDGYFVLDENLLNITPSNTNNLKVNEILVIPLNVKTIEDKTFENKNITHFQY